jgi:DNA-binding MarR family transcriptional regulator
MISATQMLSNSSPSPAAFYQPGHYRAEESVGYLMRRLLTSVAHAADRKLQPHGVSYAQWSPLLKIGLDEARTVAELARTLQMDAGAMTRLLDRLEAKHLLKRVRSSEDRRIVRLELTPEGKQVADAVPLVLCEVMNAHLAGFSKAEFEALRDYLLRMLENAGSLREAY